MPVLVCAAFRTSASAGLFRGGGSWGWDSNVFEKMEAEDRVQDNFVRLIAEVSPEPVRARGVSLGLRARGLTERYIQYASDSRYQAETTVQASRRTGRSTSLWINGRGEFRAYPDSTERNFRRGSATLGLATRSHGGDLNLAWALRGLDYRRTSSFDRRAQALAIDYRRSLHPRLDLSAAVEFEWSRYGRSAVKLPSEGPAEPSNPQEDRAREARVSVQYMRGWLFEVFGAWEGVRSNSIGYSVGRRVAGGMASGWIPGNILLQVRGRVESTSYRDKGLDDVYVFRVGENQEAGEDNNSLQLRARRPVRRGWSLEGRLAWFRNESLLVGSYYRKVVTSLGIVWTPAGSSDF